MSCDLDWAIYYAWRFLKHQMINRKCSLRISMEDFPTILGKDLYFTFTRAYLGYRKGEMEETKPGVKSEKARVQYM